MNALRKSIMYRIAIAVAVVGLWGYNFAASYKDKNFYDHVRTMGNNAQELDAVIEKAQALEKDKKLSAPLALARAASESGVLLNKHISIYGRKNPSNKAVSRFVFNGAQAKLRKGIDLQGGTEIIVSFREDEASDTDRDLDDIRDEILEILRNRVDQSGLVEAQLRPTGPTTISVTIPGKDPNYVAQFIDIIQRPAQLNFHLVAQNSDELVEGEVDGKNPNVSLELKRMLVYEDEDNPNPSGQQVVYVQRIPEELGGQHVVDAQPVIGEFGGYEVSLTFNTEGARLFGEITKDNVDRRLAIVLDGTVFSAPNINEAILGGRASISGNFSQHEANQLAIQLRCGNLPVKIRIDGQFTTDPSLGKESIESGSLSIVVGFGLTLLALLLYYRFAGVIATIALAVNVVLILGTLTLLGATLTLPGIAGIVLTIGMAVDANILIFERIREELNVGKSFTTSMRVGYQRALVTILDANITTFLTAFILAKVGSGPIKGFAMTLMIGIIATLFSALFITRIFFDISVLRGERKELKMMHLLEKARFDFLSRRKAAAILSAALLVISVGTLLVRNSNALSIDFRGGTMVTFKVADTPPISDIKRALEAGDVRFKDARVITKGTTSRMVEISVPITAQDDDATGGDIRQTMAQILGADFPQMGISGDQGNQQAIGSAVGDRFIVQAVTAIVLSLIGILIYISFRFELGYALGALAALAHDVLICTGIFCLPIPLLVGDRQLSLPVIAALLTIIGYSLNDTIVVFDRIRENLSLHRDRPLQEVVNLSLNQTLARTVLTSISTGLVVVTLYLLGGGAINDFALVLLIGVIIGTYSSLFVATPVMIAMHRRKLALKAAESGAASANAEHSAA